METSNLSRFDQLLVELRRLTDLHDGETILQVLDSYQDLDYKSVLADRSRKLEVVVHKQEGYLKTWLSRPNDPFLLGLYQWKAGAATPIHDHGDFATAFYKTLDGGQLTNIVFKKVLAANGSVGIQKKRIEVLRAEKAVAILPTTEAHIVRNDTEEDVFSLHMYVPAFERHRVWRSEYDTVRLPGTGPKL